MAGLDYETRWKIGILFTFLIVFATVVASWAVKGESIKANTKAHERNTESIVVLANTIPSEKWLESEFNNTKNQMTTIQDTMRGISHDIQNMKQ